MDIVMFFLNIFYILFILFVISIIDDNDYTIDEIISDKFNKNIISKEILSMMEHGKEPTDKITYSILLIALLQFSIIIFTTDGIPFINEITEKVKIYKYIDIKEHLYRYQNNDKSIFTLSIYTSLFSYFFIVNKCYFSSISLSKEIRWHLIMMFFIYFILTISINKIFNSNNFSNFLYLSLLIIILNIFLILEYKIVSKISKIIKEKLPKSIKYRSFKKAVILLFLE